MDFEGKVVLVTGACSGIGAETAKEFSRRGARLAMTGLGKEAPVPGLWITADLSKDDEVLRVFNETMDRFGRLDVLVNCAGILEHGSLVESSPEQLRRILGVNLTPVYYLSSLCVPALSHSSGCIVNVSSVVASRPFHNFAAYSISKAAVDQLTKVSALELSSRGIRVNAVNPGVINTDIYIRSGLTEDEVQHFFDKSKSLHALGRSGKVDEVAKTICFLASDQASFITGTCLPVDGGMHFLPPK